MTTKTIRKIIRFYTDLCNSGTEGNAIAEKATAECNALEDENNNLRAKLDVMKDLAMNVFIEMKHAETFISSRNKMHITGIAQFKDYAEQLKKTY